MNDMSAVIVPKSDQISADDFIPGPKTYTIEGVDIRPGTEQPVQIKLAGEDRVWRPCKSMSRVLVAAWGPDAGTYVGRSLTLYRDPKVKWGGIEVGGIRVSHMTHIERDMLLQLTATKGKRAPHIVKPLAAPGQSDNGRAKAETWANDTAAKMEAAQTLEALDEIRSASTKAMDRLKAGFPDLWQRVDDAYRTAALDLDATPPAGRADADMGEAHSDAE